MNEKLHDYKNETSGLDAQGIVSWAVNSFDINRIVLASSLSLEDQVLTHMLVTADRNVRILTLDTGRNFQETYDVMQSTMSKFGVKYEVYFPEAGDVENMVHSHDPNLFYESIENRKLCCDVRKVRPLKRALSNIDAWICGLRREQSVTRTAVESVEWDSSFNIFKINPLYDWTLENVKEYVRANGIPYNRLFDKGFSSIGCAPCTRAVKPGENERSGRWWWENPDRKECGLHLKK